MLQFIAGRVELLCPKCGDELTLTELKDGYFGAMESMDCLDLRCERCDFLVKSHSLCDLLIHKMAKLTTKSSDYAQQSLNDLISKLRLMVAKNSFALGIVYRELSHICEVLGQMDKCVHALKMLIPIVE